MRSKRILEAALGLGLAGALAAGCGGLSNSGGTDTNTNWLKQCTSDAECGELACLCNVCTSPCEGDGECSGRGAEAVCYPNGVSCSGGARICVSPDAPASALAELPPVDPLTGELLSRTDKDATPSACGRPKNDYISSAPACLEVTVGCPAPSEAFFDDCGCGCTMVERYPRLCRDQCPLGDACVQHPFDAFPTFAETEREWTAMCPLLGLAEGRCRDGTAFLFYSNGTVGEVRFYFPDPEFFRGLGTFTDSLDRSCGGQSYWPEPVRCERPTIVRSICGGWAVGDVIEDLPWADGRPGNLPE
jgi:hypothetical protein